MTRCRQEKTQRKAAAAAEERVRVTGGSNFNLGGKMKGLNVELLFCLKEQHGGILVINIDLNVFIHLFFFSVLAPQIENRTIKKTQIEPEKKKKKLKNWPNQVFLFIRQQNRQ